ncbi:MAG: M1 family metallopeptidase [Melioribacter sp.]|uniref:M1 family metallopeptidase n=1 Tax=Rosettibacter primus TaxID=3111523 RepID=UPI00247E7348|nr:M1 family metallopeptidase [Melioribacter sp.]
MKTYLLKLILIFLLPAVALAQKTSLFIPVNFQKAYEKETRSYDGTPGKNYWQNRADYKIKAEVFPYERKIIGEEKIVYYNNSPDTLKRIVVKLLMDIYRKGNMRDFQISPDAVNEGVELHKIVYNNNEIKFDNKKDSPYRDGTNLFIPLSKPILPKEKSEIEFYWSCKIPDKSQIRMGAYDSTSMFVAYWFPQIAVYDDIDGWDVISYTGNTETYNDFGNYEVEITVPKNFVIWATGVLQNPEEVFSEKILEKYKKALSSDEIVRIIEESDYSGLITLNKEKLTYKFKAEYVPDFAFALSNHYLWDASSLVVDKQTGRRAFISAAYNPNSKDFYQVAEIARKSIESFSTHLPGYPYPYPVMTVFNGQGGMEFPMMCNNSSVPEIQGTIHLTSHEIAHTYFPFFMGINEKKYAWMDEGWATMLPFDFQTEQAEGYDPRTRNAQGYSEVGGTDKDLPPMITSYQMRGPSYRNASYRRPAAAYEFLRNLLGDDLFKKSLHEYIKRWNGKHPVPYDFFFTFNEVSKQNLDWFWKAWFFDTKYPDLSIKLAHQKDNKVEIVIFNKGGLPLPVKINAVYDDNTEQIIYESKADIWKDGNYEKKINFNSKKKIKKIQLGNNQIPDVNIKDNTIEMK